LNANPLPELNDKKKGGAEAAQRKWGERGKKTGETKA